MAANDKDTIYIDIDDEITGVIDKVRSSGGKVVALVLPKRASVFQSVVNMKLLKRAADSSKKHLVLITTESGLMPLAGAAGIHVAKTLNSKPEIPLAPSMNDDAEEMVEESGEGPEITPATAGDTPVGDLATGAAPLAADGVETVELDDDEPPEAASPAAKSKDFTPPPTKGKKDKKDKKDKKLKVPNFERFRKLLIIGGVVLVLLIVLLVVLMHILPKATIDISTDATNVPTNLNLNLNTTADSLDPDSGTLPAKLASQQKTYTETVPTTGQKNEGNKAQGSITMSAEVCGTIPDGGPPDVPAGSGITANSLTYITQQDTSFSQLPTGGGKNHCYTYDATNATPIQAQAGGANYNTGNGSNFSVAGRSDVTATGVASGGTDNIVQVINENDINTAKSKISTSDSSTVKQSLQNQLQQGNYYAITATFTDNNPTVTSSAAVGATANTVTVTEVATYTMFGVYQNDLKTLVDNSVKSQINTNKQSILSEGLNNAVFSVNTATSTTAQLTMQTTAVAGPQIATPSIKQLAAGKKPGDVKSQISSDPDITGVKVKLSPFWVTSVPKNTSKITVTIAKPATTTGTANAKNP